MTTYWQTYTWAGEFSDTRCAKFVSFIELSNTGNIKTVEADYNISFLNNSVLVVKTKKNSETKLYGSLDLLNVLIVIVCSQFTSCVS